MLLTPWGPQLLPLAHTLWHNKDVFQSVTARSPSPNPRAQGVIVCIWKKHEGSTVSDMWRGVGGKKHQLVTTFTCSPLSCNSSNYQTFETHPEKERIQRSCDRGGYETSCSGQCHRCLGRVCVAVESWRTVYKHKNTHTSIHRSKSNP